MRLPPDLLAGTYTKPRLFLCETDKTRICQLETTDMSGSFKFNTYSELTFTVGRTYEDIISGAQRVNPFYNKIEALRLVELDGFGFFEIQDPEIISDGMKESKSITAVSLEYNLSQKYLENFYNDGSIGSIQDQYIDEEYGGVLPEGVTYPSVTLYNIAEPRLSLLHLILKKVYGWSIGHIDASLTTLSRQFNISRASVYDFITQDICDKFNCFAVFDTINNQINLYAEAPVVSFIGDGTTTSFTIYPAFDEIDTVSVNSYKTTKWTYDKETGILTLEEAPEIDADIEVVDGSQKKYMTDIYISFDNLAQEVNVSYSADDIKTVLTVKGADDLDIREVNLGLPYITDLSYYYSVDWMGQELYDAYTEYLNKCNESQGDYISNAQEMIVLSDKIAYENNRLSLQYAVAKVTSQTVGTYYVRGGEAPNYYYTEVSLPSDYNANVKHYYSLSGNDLTEEKFSKFYEGLKTYFSSEDAKDVADIEKVKDEFAFMETYSIADLISDLSSATTLEEKNKAISTFLDDLWKQLGLTPLVSLYQTPYTTTQNTNIEAGWDKEESEHYWKYYPVTLVLTSLKTAITKRNEDISAYEEDYNLLQEKNIQITNKILMDVFFESYFKEKGLDDVAAKTKARQMLIRLNPFLREDEYTDDNFVETSYETTEELIKLKKELLECGRIELKNLCEPKLAFSMDMANIYALKEFEPIVDHFQLGNLISIELRPKTKTEDAYVKQARLLQVNFNFEDFADFSCEFGELTSLKTPSSIHADLLANAIQAGKSVASNASYWNKGVNLATETDLKIQQGLLDATNGLYSSTQGVIIDKNGIRLTKIINSETGEVSPYQAWIRNNNILLSSDGFKTSRVGLGEFTVDGTTFYGLLAEAMFSGYIESSTIVGGKINIGDGTFVVDEYGNVTMNAASIKGYVEEDGVISSINQSPESISINANKISLAGKNIDLTSDNITIDSTNFSVDKDGKMTATSGEIAGWTIYPGLLRKETTVGDMDYQIYMQSTDGVSTSNAFVVRKKKSTDSSWDYQFSVNYEGRLMAKNADITGSITAEDGSIAGFNIGPGGSYSNALYKRISGDVSDYEVGLKASSGDTDLAFYVKESTDDWETSSNTFFVRNNGQLYAQNAVITGEVNASSGKIGGWNIGDMGGYTGSIYSTYCAASTPSESNPEYAVFMRGKGSSAANIAIGVKKRTSSATDWDDAEEPFYVLKNGRVKMADADVTGKINASSGSITGNLNISGGLINTQGDYTVTLRGVQSDVGKGVFYITDNSSGSAEYPVRINGDGSARFTNVTITGSSTIAAACIPDLNANKITSGTISTSILDSSVITTGNFSSQSLSTGKLSVTYGGNIGVWTVNSNNYLYAISGDYGVSLSATSVSHGQGGSATWVNIVKAGQNASDERLKKNIVDLDDCLDNVFDNLKPVQFEYSKEFLGQGTHFGYIAQDVIKSFEDEGKNINDYSFIYETEIEDNSEDKYYQLNKTDFIALNTWQIQKLKARVEELEKKLEALEG